jgi:molecular chaperone HtpG
MRWLCLLICIALFTFGLGQIKPSVVAAEELQRIILINVEGLNYEAYISTPMHNLRQIAAEGLMDEKCLAIRTDSSEAALASLLTGALPEDHGYYNSESKIQVESLLALLKKHGRTFQLIDGSGGKLQVFNYGQDQYIALPPSSLDQEAFSRLIQNIPEQMPFDFYTREYEKGLELYSSGVLIMDKCPDLLPDFFSFVKGMVDSEDLSLNISREMLQHDRQLKIIAKNIKNRIKTELSNMLKDEREKYEQFYKSFGRQLKYGIYEGFGMNKEMLQDLLLFYSSRERKMVTLSEYVSRMPEDQKYIYYAAGESIERIDKMPQTELITDKGYEILYFTEDVDEFAIRMLMNYQEKEFKSVSSGDLGIDPDTDKENQDLEEKDKELFQYMKNVLGDKVKDVRASKRLKNHPVCLANEGDLTIEMEKILNAIPTDQKIKAERILEINNNHEVFQSLREAFANDKEKLDLYTHLLYNQALMIEGLPLEDPLEFSNNICSIMK